MTYLVEQESGYLIVNLEGEVDLNHSPEARKTILQCLQRRSNLLVDLSAVTYIDSSGVASLVEGYQVAKTANLEFALIGVSESVMSVLHLARLDQVFPIYDSLAHRLQGEPPKER